MLVALLLVVVLLVVKLLAVSFLVVLLVAEGLEAYMHEVKIELINRVELILSNKISDKIIGLS